MTVSRETQDERASLIEQARSTAREARAWKDAIMPWAPQFSDHVADTIEALVARLERVEEALPDGETLAEWFHEEYERLAPGFHYDTRTDSAVPWSQVPHKNRMLMIATAGAIRDRIFLTMTAPVTIAALALPLNTEEPG